MDSDSSQFDDDGYPIRVNFAPKRKPDYRRRELLARPTVRRLLASGFYAVKTQNEKVLTNLENMLCCSLRDTVDPGMSNDEWRRYLNKFVEEHRPASPYDPDKFTRDNIDQPIFYETYQRYRAHIIHTYRMYNFRGRATPVAATALNYTPTERILALSKSRPNTNFTIGGSRTSLKLRSISVQRLNQRRRIKRREMVSQQSNNNTQSIQRSSMPSRNLQAETMRQMMQRRSVQRSSLLGSTLQSNTMSSGMLEENIQRPLLPLQNASLPQNYFKSELSQQRSPTTQQQYMRLPNGSLQTKSLPHHGNSIINKSPFVPLSEQCSIDFSSKNSSQHQSIDHNKMAPQFRSVSIQCDCQWTDC